MRTTRTIVAISSVAVLIISGVAQSSAVAAGNSSLGFDPAIYLSAPVPGGAIIGGSSSVIGDVSGDGLADLVVTSDAVTASYSDELVVYKQTAAHGLSQGRVYPLPAEKVTTDRDQAFLTDMNGDGRADVVVAVSAGVEVLLQGAHGSLHPPVRFSISGGGFETVADLDGDGHPDVVAIVPSTNGSGLAFQVFWGTTATTFTPGQLVNLPVPTGTSIPTSVRVGDLNGDHWPDVVVTGGSFWTSIQSARRNFSIPTKTYQVVDAYGPMSSSGADVGDVNGDGRADVVLSASTGAVDIFYGQANGSLLPVRLVYGCVNPTGVAIGDLNGDGRNDIAVMSDGFNSISTIIQQPTGSLATALHPVPVQYPQFEQFGMSIGDVNDDGLKDLALVGSYQAVVHQTNPPPAPQLVGGSIDLAAPASARAGVAFTVTGQAFYQPGMVASPTAQPFTGQTLTLQKASTSNGPWTDVAHPLTDNMGNFAAAITLTTSAYIRVTYPGSPTMYPMIAPSHSVKIT